MATNHTEHYNLNLWEPSDKFVRAEFNENSQKIDAALAAKAETSVTAALCTDVDTLKTTKGAIVVGSYVGDGQYGSSRTLTFSGMTPKLVIIRPASGQNVALILIRGMGSTQYTLDANNYFNNTVNVSWGSESVSWYSSAGAEIQLNASGVSYCYVAIG